MTASVSVRRQKVRKYHTKKRLFFFLLLAVVIFNLLGDTVRDCLDPRNSRKQ